MFQVLEIRRAFTVFQLMTILEVARRSLIIIEHDPLLYVNAQGMMEYVSRVCTMLPRDRSSALLTRNRYFLEDMTKNADRIFYFYNGARATDVTINVAYTQAEKSRITSRLDRFSMNTI